ncbi:MAG: Serine/threonine-protein kinase PrkC [Planctomycetota bacterium]
MSTGGDGLDPVDALAQDFLAGVRQGGSADVAAFCAAHPQHAEALAAVLPMLLALEQAKARRSSTTGTAPLAVPALQRLGEYRIVREVGRGGMGVVFEAVQEPLERRVALKVLPQATGGSGRKLERFRREARAASRLHHTNIVPVFGSGEHEGIHYFAMQFIDGHGLDHWVSAQREAGPGAMTPSARARFAAHAVAQAAEALHSAHEDGVLHRDVKPSNLLLEHGDHVWVTDFGLAKALAEDTLTLSGDVLGTPQYMAPEQFAGHYDVRSEVYALGVALHELVALDPPFRGNSRAELMARIREGSAQALDAVVPGVPRDLAVVAAKAMALAPADRYPTAAALADDLRRFLAGEPIHARPLSAVQELWRWCGRNRALAGATGLAVVALLLATVVGWTSYLETEQSRARAVENARTARIESDRANANLGLALSAFEELFDSISGPDPFEAIDEDLQTGEDAAVVRSALSARDVAMLEQLLSFYDQFSARNADSESLREQTARANRRVAAILARLGRLDEAAAACERSLALYREVTIRDVTVDIASVHLELAQVELRKDRGPAATARCRAAIQMLAGDAADHGRAARFTLARAHLLLASSLTWRPESQRGGRPGGGPQGPPTASPGAGQLPSAARAEARRSLAECAQLVEELRKEAPAEVEFQLLEARCLLAMDRAEGARAGSDSSKRLTRALALMEDLVARHPDVDAFRFELAEMLTSPPRRVGGGPGAAPPVAIGAEELARIERGEEIARQLAADHPDNADYVLCLMRARLRLAAALLYGNSPDRALEVARRPVPNAPVRAGDEARNESDAGYRVRLVAVEARALLVLGRTEESKAAVERLLAALPRGSASDRLVGAAELRNLSEVLEQLGLGDRLRQLRPRPERGR